MEIIIPANDLTLEVFCTIDDFGVCHGSDQDT